MNDFEPVAVALKFGFIAVLYLFLLWVSRSALRDLRRGASGPADTGVAFSRPAAGQPVEAWLAVAQAGGSLQAGERFDLIGGLTIGRSAQADIQIDDPYASQVHTRVYAHGGEHYVEDMNSTNGTFLNAEPVSTPMPLRSGDVIAIGDIAFRYEL